MQIDFIERIPSDLIVVNSARVSFNKHHDELLDKDSGLIRYLAKHNHFSPFTHARETFRSAYTLEPIVYHMGMSNSDAAGMVHKDSYQTVRHSIWGWANLIHKGLVDPDAVPFICNTLWEKYPLSAKAMELPTFEKHSCPIYNDEYTNDPDFIDVTLRETIPIFIARQRFKHSVDFTYNEVSRRYVDDDPVFWETFHWRGNPENKKQGSTNEAQVQVTAGGLSYDDILDICFHWYKNNSHIAPEQRRAILPQAMMTSYYVTGNLTAWARAFNLRNDPHAQYEIQELAQEWNSTIGGRYPKYWRQLTGQSSEQPQPIPS